MIRKTTILFLALALLATVARGADGDNVEAGDAQLPSGGAQKQGGENKSTEEKKSTEAPKLETPAENAPKDTQPDAGSNSDAATPEAPAEGGNGTSSSGFMSYGLGASVVLLAAL
ncbi:hypothetical protein CRE_29430 [Caenorhabditis remanei]|uniref:Uncharacterized protein n=1 Tax=Caenorhabditis remanei TaxID=31234 RepID=E3LUZ3_CAERE|nr:hypothetical protein CRE_29430 [Caenorhabditis remanei]